MLLQSPVMDARTVCHWPFTTLKVKNLESISLMPPTCRSSGSEQKDTGFRSMTSFSGTRQPPPPPTGNKKKRMHKALHKRKSCYQPSGTVVVLEGALCWTGKIEKWWKWCMKAADNDIPVLHGTSFRNEDFVFDSQIVTEEVAATIRCLKCRKASSLSTWNVGERW